ncbi:Holliday junction resolvase RecU [Striga asiatica]|uniref:Holliday junction resolvase RecU n=1 Tax=Striga asiatica TaxID=4170 RepID=A0A5A7QDR8_STRAF|nr:Holliday junction resolvase RecU [Striga asiatica]
MIQAFVELDLEDDDVDDGEKRLQIGIMGNENFEEYLSKIMHQRKLPPDKTIRFPATDWTAVLMSGPWAMATFLTAFFFSFRAFLFLPDSFATPLTSSWSAKVPGNKLPSTRFPLGLPFRLSSTASSLMIVLRMLLFGPIRAKAFGLVKVVNANANADLACRIQKKNGKSINYPWKGNSRELNKPIFRVKKQRYRIPVNSKFNSSYDKKQAIPDVASAPFSLTIKQPFENVVPSPQFKSDLPMGQVLKRLRNPTYENSFVPTANDALSHLLR